jgi:Beta-lactamase class C and other penicillin binding proteins
MSLKRYDSSSILNSYSQREANLTISYVIIEKDKTTFYGPEELLFEIGSNAKLLTGAIISKIVFEKKIDLNERVDRYFDFMPMKPQPTVLDLLTQHGYRPLISSRFLFNYVFKRYTMSHNIYDRYTNESVFLYIAQHPKKHRRYFYSDLNFAVLGLLAEKVTHKSYAELFKEIIQDELELRNTFLESEVPPSLPSYYHKKKSVISIGGKAIPLSPREEWSLVLRIWPVSFR